MNPHSKAFPVFARPGFPASETESQEGITLSTYAAIHLRVPESGIKWLDDMIRKAVRRDVATAALQGALAGSLGQAAETDEFNNDFGKYD